MTIARKLIIAMVLFVTLIGLTGLLAIHQLSKVTVTVNGLVNEEFPQMRYAGALRAEVLDFRNRESQLLIINSPSEVDEVLGRQKNNAQAIENFAASLERAVGRESERALFKDYRQGWSAYLSTHEELVRLARSGDQAAAIAHFRGEQRKSFRNVLPVIDKMVEEANADSERLSTETKTLLGLARTELLAAIGLAVIIGAATGFGLYRSVVGPLERVRNAVVDIARTLDFTNKLTIVGNDEVSSTAKAVDQLLTTLQGTLTDFIGGVTDIARVAEQLSTAAREVESSAANQSDSSASMAAAVEQLTVSINAVAENTTKLSVAAKDADHAAGEGGETMRQTIDQLRRVGVRVEETATSITSLSKASAEISSIVRTIREVADQTNLLALNAAIEAARAGEQGRGFAVVADEVRKLAERTRKATEEISQMVLTMQSSAHDAVAGMDSVVTRVFDGARDPVALAAR
ncbi:MAG TPA: methyl-accepting chemotaxis protein, partial [Accumulibacter sp.]|nr:methyl-accepting chemotaxis protein [Accumulibacter sp.]